MSEIAHDRKVVVVMLLKRNVTHFLGFLIPFGCSWKVLIRAAYELRSLTDLPAG